MEVLIRERERVERDRVKGLPHAQQIFDLARHNPLVASALGHWRSGALTWEQTLIAIATTLANQNRSLLDHLRPPPVAVATGR